MPASQHPKLLDLVAVISSPPDSELEVGDVGTVVELLPPDGLEVEFSNLTATPATWLCCLSQTSAY